MHTFLTWKRGCLVDGESTSIGAFSAMFASWWVGEMVVRTIKATEDLDSSERPAARTD